MSMAANKIKGIRAALCSDCFSAQATKEHNNANVLCMGARVIGPELAFRIADTFLNSKFSNDEDVYKRQIQDIVCGSWKMIRILLLRIMHI